MTHKTDETDRLLKVKDIIRPEGMLPICRSSFWKLVQTGVVSPGVRLGSRTRAWRQSEILTLVNRLEADEAARARKKATAATA